ncbi:hypothetical protein ACRALDRAFT_1074348 [Sodiomyces alcalophilus JCM 7366]|uniref:uncharacterized protein n=1 Tax=Sodiomyces alcalophilus JCM 7366 TaxID=591952 RepID=UPI0039B5F4CD
MSPMASNDPDHQEPVNSRHDDSHDADTSISPTPLSPRDAAKRSRDVVTTGNIPAKSAAQPPIASPTYSTPAPAPPAPSLPTIPDGNSDEDLSSSFSSSASSYSSSFDSAAPHPPATPNGTSPAPPSPTPSKPTPPNKKNQEGNSAIPRKSSASASIAIKSPTRGRVRRLSAVDMQQLASEAESLPIAVFHEEETPLDLDRSRPRTQNPCLLPADQLKSGQSMPRPNKFTQPVPARLDRGRDARASDLWSRTRPGRTSSTPPGNRKSQTTHGSSPRRNSVNPSARPPASKLGPNFLHPNADDQATRPFSRHGPRPPPISTAQPQQPRPFQSSAQSGLSLPSPMPPSIPLPPMSIPTHLQLELSTERPSPLYIHTSHVNDIPFESTAVKLERLKNVLLLPLHLERALNFGTLACLDAWLYNFTILPIRFCLAVGVLIKWWCYLIVKEAKWAVRYVWHGLGRVWSRGKGARRDSELHPCADCDGQGVSGRARSQRETSHSQDMLLTQEERLRATQGVSSLRLRLDTKTAAAMSNGHAADSSAQHKGAHYKGHEHHRHWGHGIFRHRRTKSLPSNLTNMHKADILLGGVIILSSLFLMKLDASRMYHVIRGQDAIKLYVIYNVLEVGDRLLSALGQDVFECLLSTETVSRTPAGRSKVLMPAGLFLLALTYNIIHSVALYYQVITLNVAVNSYSNALLTLLLSNQFVEVKSTVFKRFEKDNLFQLTCADIAERFQLWLMIFIIGMRNVVEVGGLSIPGTSGDTRATSTKPLHSPSILPHSFTVLPSWIWSGEVLSPFLIVIGSEILVDTIKHAYINKFNKIKPTFYSRILDILSKDYYTNAFDTPSLTRRVGLAVAPLSCLFIRSSIQTYHMFLSSHVSNPIVESTQTSLSAASATPSSPAMLAALDRLDTLLRDALGRSVYGYPYGRPSGLGRGWLDWTTDDVIAAATMLVVFFIAFLVLLIIKILLGMALLRYSRNRYEKMKVREHLIATGQTTPESYAAEGKRLGGYGHIEVTEDKRRWIHADKDEGLKGKGRPDKSEKKPPDEEYQGVQRYEMVTRRIW